MQQSTVTMNEFSPVSFLKRSLLLVTALSLTACTDYTSPERYDDVESAPEAQDPLEPFNRAMFSFNEALDNVLLKPAAEAYDAVIPEGGQQIVGNVLSNFEKPVDLANSIFQGDVENSFATFWSFVLNSTVGLGGMIDVAEDAGLEPRPTDFGQTMAVWGVNSGAYLVLPVFGPSTLRDGAGRGADIVMDPMTWFGEDYEWIAYTRAGVYAVHTRAENLELIENLYETSFDPYVTFRSAYLQRRTSEITKAKEAVRCQNVDTVITSTCAQE